MNLRALFGAAQLRLPASRLPRGPLHARYRLLFGRWPVQLVGADGWAPLPAEGALAHEERTIVAVRGGSMAAHRVPGVVYGAVHGLPAAGQEARLRGFAAVYGSQILDLIALPPRGSADQLRQLTGAAAALGDPFDDLAEPAEAAIPVARDVAEWIRLAMDGAVLPLGDADARAGYLRGLGAPLLAADLAHGLELEKLLRRPVVREPPAILLPQPIGRAA